jgi:hypothetical protein
MEVGGNGNGLVITFRIGREGALLNLILVPAESLQSIDLEMRVGFDELRHKLIE